MPECLILCAVETLIVVSFASYGCIKCCPILCGIDTLPH